MEGGVTGIEWPRQSRKAISIMVMAFILYRPGDKSVVSIIFEFPCIDKNIDDVDKSP